MAKSLFNQFSQIRGSRTYEDGLELAFAEISGRVKETGLSVDISGTSVTRSAGVFEKRDVGNFLVIGGSAYGITAADGTATCTVASAPGDASGASAVLMYYQNLEDDLNYIRTMLREITGLSNWYTPPTVALSELTFNFIELVDVFIGGGTYTANNMLYTVSSGVKDTNLMTFDPNTQMFTASNITTGGTLDVDGAADFDSTLNVQGGVVLQSTLNVVGDTVLQSNVTVSGTFQFDAAGQAVSSITTSIGVGSTDSELPTAAAVYNYVDTVAAGIDTFLELGDTFSFYTANNMMYTTASGISDTNKLTYTPGTDTFAVSAATTNVTGVANFDSTVDVDGAVTLNSSLDVDGAVVMHSGLSVEGDAGVAGTVTVSGSLKFDASGQTVDNIVTTISEPGADTNLATEQAIVEYVTAVSGILFNQIEAIDTFLELEDTPNAYSDGALVYSQDDEIAFTTEINYTGTALNINVPTYISQDVRTDGDIIVGQTLTVTGTSTLINDVNVQGNLDVDTDLNVDGDSVVDGNSLVGGNVTVSGTFQFDASGQTVNNIATTIPGSGPGSNNNLVTEAAIFDFVNTVSGVLSASTAAQTFLALTDTDTTSYTAGNMFYTNASGTGIIDTNKVTFDGAAFNITVDPLNDTSSYFAVVDTGRGDNAITYGTDGAGSALLAISAPATTISSQTSTVIKDSSDNIFVTTQDGLFTVKMAGDSAPFEGFTLSGSVSVDYYDHIFMSLEQGVQVNDIYGSIGEAVAQDTYALATVEAIRNYINAFGITLSGTLDTFIEMNDTPDVYNNTKLVYSTSSDIQYADNLSYTGSGLVVSGTLNTTGAVTFDSTLDVDGATTLNSTLDVDGATTLNSTLDVDGATTLNSSLVVSGTTNLQSATYIDSSLDVDGATTLNSTLDVDGDASFNSNVTVSGTFKFDSTGQAVNEISITMDPAGGDDTTLLTESAIWDWVNTVSGVLSDATSAQTFLALTDTPADYTDDKYKLVRVNDAEDALIFEAALTFSGTTFSVAGNVDATGTLDVDGAATFGNNVTVNGEFGFDTGETVTSISGAMSAPGDNDTLLTSAAIYDWVNTVSGSLQGDVLWEVVDTPSEQVRLKAEHLTKAIWHGGNLTIAGDLTVSGTTTTINTNELTVEDKLITVNAGEAGAGITGDPLAGIEIDRGSEANYLFVFNEEADNFRVGVSGTMTPGNTYALQAVCTREDSPIDMRVPWWDADDYIYRNTGDTYIAVNSGTHTLSVVADSDTKMTVAADNVKLYGDGDDYVEINSSGVPFFKVALDGNTELDVTSSGLALDSGARVDDITTVITEPGDDMTLATEKAIVDYVTQVSGVLASQTSSQTFLALTDTEDATYEDGRVLRYTATGVSGTPYIYTFPTAASPDLRGSIISVNNTDESLLAQLGVYHIPSDDSLHFVVDTPDLQIGSETGNSVYVRSNLTPMQLQSMSETIILYTAAGNKDIIARVGDGSADHDELTINNSGIKLRSGADVNNIVTSITEPGSDDNLATEQAIVEYVTAASGVLQNNIDHVEFLDLDDVFVTSYTANNMFYATASGVMDTDELQFSPSAHTFTIKPNDAQMAMFSQTTQTIGNADGEFVNVDQSGSAITIGVATVAEVTVNSAGLSLKTGASVNDISTAMSPTGDDDTLLTEKAIYDWINTVSGAISTGGSLNHNDLQGLQGGASGEYYHLNLTAYAALSGVSSSDVSNWNTAYSWGDHAGLYSLVDHLHDDRYYTETEMDATVSGINATIVATSGTLQGQIDLLEAIHADTEEPTGFVNRLDSSISNDNTNVTISGTSWDYYIKGVKYTVAGAKSMAIDGAFEGMQYFYMDTDSALHRMNSWSDDLITDYAYVAAVYWDDANSSAIYMGDERHGVVMDATTHKYLHNTIGTAYISGLALDPAVVDGNGSANSHAQVAANSGVIADEDVYHSIPTYSGTGAEQIPVFYRTGNPGLWRKSASTDFPVKAFSGGAGRLAYNQISGGSWQQTEVAKGDFVLAHIFATNDPTMPWIAVQGQSTYDTNTEARLGATTEMNSLILAGLPFVEFLPVGTVIFQTDEDYTNDINARIITTDEGADYVDWTKTKISPVPGSVNDHGNLSGLQDLDHPASAIFTDTTNFNGALSASDNTVQKALDTLDNAIAGIGHEHHDHDLAEVSTNVWEYAGDTGFSTVPTDLQVFVNGLKNRKTSDYYTAAISGGKITITFAYNVYTEDWINVTYTKADVA